MNIVTNDEKKNAGGIKLEVAADVVIEIPGCLRHTILIPYYYVCLVSPGSMKRP